MKARSKILQEKSMAAMLSAIEIYNKPDFKYRAETFSILSINAWELLLKAKYLKLNSNKINSLYVMRFRKKKDGNDSKFTEPVPSSTGNPKTLGLGYILSQLFSQGEISESLYKNINLMIEIRDSSVHFYNENKLLLLQLEEVGHAVVQNFFKASKNWFEVDLSEYNFYLMPLGLHKLDFTNEITLLNSEEKNLIRLISDESGKANQNDEYDVCLNINIKFDKSSSNESLKVALSNDPGAQKISLTDDQFRNKYKLDYAGLLREMSGRYKNFKQNDDFHDYKKKIIDNQKYCMERFLDPGNPKSSKKRWYSIAVLNHFDKFYVKK